VSVPDDETFTTWQEYDDQPAARPTTGTAPTGLTVSVVADHWGLVLGLGILSVLLGIVLSVWPRATLGLLAVLVALQLLASGVLSLVAAIGSGALDRSTRTLVGLSGIVAVLLGLVCLRAPQQTLAVIALLIGLWWVFKGLVDVVRSLAPVATSTTPRLWTLLVGIVTAVAGGFVVLYPEISFSVLLVVVEVWLFAYGFLTIVTAFGMRSAAERLDG